MTFITDNIIVEGGFTGDTVYFNTFSANTIDFITPINPNYIEGRVFYDTTEKSISYYNDVSGITLNIGQENWVRVRNDGGSPILNGKIVYINGVETGTDIPLIGLAKSNNATTSTVIGMSTHDISNNDYGYITAFGVVHNINTSGFTSGEPIFLSPNTAGEFEKINSIGNGLLVPIGNVLISDSISGSVLINMGTSFFEGLRQGRTVIRDVNDFPEPVGNNINLLNNNIYEIDGVINMGGYNISVGDNSVLKGINVVNDYLIYTGTTPFISSIGNSFEISNLHITTPYGCVFSSTGNSTTKISILYNLFDGCDSIGEFNGGELVFINNNLIKDFTNSGLTFTGVLDYPVFFSNLVKGGNIDNIISIPSGIFKNIKINENIFQLTGTTTGLTIYSGITLDEGLLSDNMFNGSGATFITGIDKSNVRWKFTSNTGLEDSQIIGDMYMVGNTVDTVIGSTATYYHMSGTTSSDVLERLSHNGTISRLTYIGLRPARVVVTCSFSVSVVAGSGQTLRGVIAINGTIQNKTEQEIRTSSSGQGETGTCIGVFTLNPNDYVEFFVRNTTSTNSVLVENMIMSING